MVNSVLSAPPTFYMCSLKIPPQLIKQIYVYMKHRLWSKGDINRKGTCLCMGDSLQTQRSGRTRNYWYREQNNALLMKYLDKFYNRTTLGNIDLEQILLQHYTTTCQEPSWLFSGGRTSSNFLINSKASQFAILAEATQLFSRQQNLKDRYPQLFSFTRKPKCSLRYFLDQEVDRIFRLPLSSQAAR